MKVKVLFLTVALIFAGSLARAQSKGTIPKLNYAKKAQPSADLKKMTKTPPEAKDLQLILDLESLNKEKHMPSGPRVGGGGNSCALTLQGATEKLLPLLSTDSLALPEEKIEILKKKTKKTKFYLAHQLALNGQSKDAINYPYANTIYVTQDFCRSLEGGSPTALSLLLHEYLGLARIDDSRYQLSSAFAEQLSKVEQKELETFIFLTREAAKDIKGRKSCFKGLIRKINEDLIETLGGRYSENSFSYKVVKIGEEFYRDPYKYATLYGPDGKEAESYDSKSVAKLTVNITDTEDFIFVVTSSFANTGTVGETSNILYVRKSVIKEWSVLNPFADNSKMFEELPNTDEKTMTTYECSDQSIEG